MPSYEMPLEEMKEYRGSSPCPKDFDTYWSDALAELDAVKPEPGSEAGQPFRPPAQNASICILRVCAVQKFTQSF